MNDCTTVYRAAVKGSWTARVTADPAKAERHINALKNALTVLNEETEHRYKAVIDHKQKEYEFLRSSFHGDWKTLLSPHYRDIFSAQPLNQRIKIRIKAAFPFLVDIKRKLKK